MKKGVLTGSVQIQFYHVFRSQRISTQSYIRLVSQLCKKNYEIQLRRTLNKFCSSYLEITEKLPETRGSNHLSGQLVRSGTAPALHYGEAQSAESRKDFIHKMKIALKEMRESLICLKIIERKRYLTDQSIMNSLSELNELISIFVKSIDTAKTNLKKLNTEY